MTMTNDTRPEYFEGQYLGAADLTAAVTYARTRDARHMLGGHVWGIAAGLQLYEIPHTNGDGGVDVFIRPGYAWDGYGRPIVVLAPYQIPASLAQNFPTTGGPYQAQIWIQYSQNETLAPQPGFEICDGGDSFSRVVETFSLTIVGPNANAPQPATTPISVAGQSIPANQAYSFTNSDDALLADASVPFQSFPDDGATSPWPIPLGAALWMPGTTPTQPGMFVPNPSPDTNSDPLRMYIGVIASQVLAPDGQVIIRDRINNYSSSTLVADNFLTVQGSTLAQGDVRLQGTRLDFRTTDGTSQKIPLTVSRNDSAGLTTLDLALGNNSNPAMTVRLGIGPADQNGTVTENLVVQSDGSVGIGTTTPLFPLQVASAGIGIGTNASAQSNFFISANSDAGSGSGTAPPGLRVYKGDPTNNKMLLTIANTGNVGIGTANPLAPLHISAAGIEVGTDTNDPTQNFYFIADPGSPTSAFRLYNGDAGAGTHLATVLSNGNVGIGTYATNPTLTLEIQGDFGCSFRSTTAHLFGSTIGDVGHGILFFNSGGGTVTIDSNSANPVLVGIGTRGGVPQDTLDVRGNIRLGNGGSLYAPGASENLRMIRGTYIYNPNSHTGTGFQVTPVDSILLPGLYDISFTDSFPAGEIPSATVTQIFSDSGSDGGSTLDNVVIVSISNTGMRIKTGDKNGDGSIRSFTFIVVGSR